MTEFLKESELPERKVFIQASVKEVLVMPGKAVIRYAIPMAADSHTPGGDSEEVVLGS